MGTAVLAGGSRALVRGWPALAWTLAPAAVALALGSAYLVAEPRPGDLAAHVFRAELFGREGFTIWNGQWYGGHHTPPYWFAATGCVERTGEWTRVIARERGFMRLSTRFAPERIVEHGRRCDDG